MILFVLLKHHSDVFRHKIHIYSKIRRYIPRTVIFGFLFRMQFKFQVFHIIHPCQYHGSEGTVASLPLLQVFVSQQPQKGKKDLVIRIPVDLVNDQYDLPIQTAAERSDPFPQIVQRKSLGDRLIPFFQNPAFHSLHFQYTADSPD